MTTNSSTKVKAARRLNFQQAGSGKVRALIFPSEAK
jgi:hypothetical protein